MKRSEIKRGKQLQRTELKRSSMEVAKSWLARSKALGRKPATKKQPRGTGPDRETRALVLERDGHRCIACGLPEGEYRGVDGRLDIHHRRARAMGGSRLPDTNQPQNLITLHRRCHDFVERNREAALSGGRLVPQGTDPASVPVLYWPLEWRLLAADGSYEVVSGPGREQA